MTFTRSHPAVAGGVDLSQRQQRERGSGQAETRLRVSYR
jgi:hypothetical protein